MGFYSIWPSAACLVVLLLIASTQAFSPADSPPSPRKNRLRPLDGLRGFLALAVFFHHASIYHGFVRDGSWSPPPSRFYSALGPMGVSMFFMITGYLFWSRLIREKGQPSWLQLYIGRLFRIGPLFLATSLVTLLVVSVQTGFVLHVSRLQVLGQVGRWLALGFLNSPDVNGYLNTRLLVADVTWTIRWEWVFYLSLPILALAARRVRLYLPFVVTCLLGSLTYIALHPNIPGYKPRMPLVTEFLAGMACASLHGKGLSARLSDRVSSAAVLVLVLLVFLFRTPYLAVPIILLGLVLYLITSGCSVFGVLVSRPAIRLGDISYGIYLLQGFALAALFRPAILRSFATSSPAAHWSLTLVTGTLLITLATATHVAIERPGIQIGARIGSRFERKARAGFIAGRDMSYRPLTHRESSRSDRG